jgi:hypothetical protein
MNETQRGTVEMESTKERQGVYIGRLRDLGLGNINGIPSRYADASRDEIQEVAHEKARKLVAVTESNTFACIDGRRCVQNADGSEPAIRYRRVGGTAANYGVARNADASIVDTLSDNDTLGHQIHIVDEQLGFERTAHLGQCGGANGEVDDNLAIASNPSIMNAVKSIMEIPLVRAYLEVDFNSELGNVVRHNAQMTAEYLQAHGWNGQAYVDGVCEENPHGVEDLEVDQEDEKFHGHKENTLSIIIGDETLPDDDEFVWNLYTTKKVAERLAGQRGTEGYTQALIAEIAKHVAVANRLPGQDTPILLLAS